MFNGLGSLGIGNKEQQNQVIAWSPLLKAIPGAL